MEDWLGLFGKAWEVCRHLFNTQELIGVLQQPGFLVAAFVVLTAVIFTETGLLVGFCLPGDSLLVTAGLVWYQLINPEIGAGIGFGALPLLLVLLSVAAIVGDTVGYWIGLRTGPKIFSREKSLLFSRDHLLKAQAFYERHGGKTIILARFMPIIRTFAPVVAGVGQMKYSRFLAYNVVGGIGWVFSMVLLGYALTPFLNPALGWVFGEGVKVQDHVEKVIILVVLLSIAPGIVAGLRSRFGGTAKPVAVEVP
jgi:membrane-associated protein